MWTIVADSMNKGSFDIGLLIRDKAMQTTGFVRNGASWKWAFTLVVFATVLNRPAMADDAPPAINSICPVMADEPVDPKVTLTFRGKTIAFCCERCRKKFKANPDRYLAALPEFTGATETTAGNGPVEGGANGGLSNNSASEGSIDAKSQAGEQVAGNDAGAEGEQAEAQEEKEDEPFLGRLHPVLVHFPLAGVPLALLGFLVWVVASRDAFAKADVPPLLASALFSIAAVITGNIAHDAIRYSRSMHEIVEQHEFVSTSVMILILVLTLLRIWRWNRLDGRWRWIYGGGLCLATAMLMITGYLGGSLVFGPDHLKL